jgi:hypothetical protein
MSGGAGRLLPIWHAITKEELLSHSPSLVDRVALITGNLTIEEMAEQLAEVIHPGEESWTVTGRFRWGRRDLV